MKSGSLFSHHGYYALILVPWMAFAGALFLERLPKRLAAFVLIVGFIESIANQQHDFFIKPEAFNKLQLESIANRVSQSTDLVGLVSNANPNEFYFLNRKGWLVEPANCNDAYLQSLMQRGCRYWQKTLVLVIVRGLSIISFYKFSLSSGYKIESF